MIPTAMIDRTLTVSSLLIQVNQEEQLLHVGVRIFIRHLKQQGMFGPSLRNELEHIKKIMIQCQTIHKYALGLKAGTPDYADAVSKYQSKWKEAQQKMKTIQLLVRNDNLLLNNLNHRLKVFYADENKLLNILQQLYPYQQRGKYMLMIRKTKEGLKLILPLFEEISAKYYDFQGKLMSALSYTWNQFRQNIQNQLEFESVIREVNLAEELLIGLISTAEQDAHKIEKLIAYQQVNNMQFIKIIEKLATQPTGREEMKEHHITN